MNSDRRRDAATLAVGVGGTALGGAIREDAIDQAQRNTGAKRSRPPGRVMLRGGAGGGPRRMYAAGAALGLASAPAAAVGAYNLTRNKERRSGPSDPRRSFLREGVDGASEALRHKAKNATDRQVRNSDRAKAAGVAAGAGALSGFGAHRLLDAKRPGIGSRSRAGIAAAAGVLGAAGSLPLSSRTVSRGYKVTPVGVERDERVRKYDPTMSDKRKRAAVMGAGSIPIVGDFAAAGAAARLAPPGQERSAAVRQYAGSNAGQLGGMAAGAYGASALARSNGRVGASTVRAADTVNAGAAKAKSAVGLGAKAKTKPGLTTRAAQKSPRFARAISPLRARPAVAAAGALVGGFAGSQIGGQSAYSRTLAKERKWKNVNSSHVRKYQLSPADHARQMRRKKRNELLSASGASVGLTGLGLLGAAKIKKIPAPRRAQLKNAATNTAVLGGGVGAINSLQWARIARTENRAESDVRKSSTSRRRYNAARGRDYHGNPKTSHPQLADMSGRELSEWKKAQRQRMIDSGGIAPKAAPPKPKGRLAKPISNRLKYLSLAPAAGVAYAGHRGTSKDATPEQRKRAANVAAAGGAAAGGAYLGANRIRDVVGRTKVHPSRLHYTKVGAGTLAAAALWTGARHRVEKRETKRRDVDAAFVGAGTAGLGYQGAGYRASMRSAAHEKDIRANPDFKDRAKAHQRRHKIKPGVTPAGAPEWKAYFRTYPKDLPGGRLKRVLSRTHGGKSGVLLTAGVAGAGGLSAGAASRKVGKSFPSGRLVKVTPGAGRVKSFRRSYYRAPRTLGAPPTRVRAGMG